MARSAAGGPINQLWLAQQLSPFGIHSRALRIGVNVGKGYSLEDLGMRLRGMEGRGAIRWVKC